MLQWFCRESAERMRKMKVLEIYALCVGIMSVIAFGVCGLDKWKAKKGRWRVPEKVLFLLAGLGGAWGFLTGMVVFRHKTNHWSFRIGVPLLSVLWTAVTGILVWKTVSGM